MGVYISQYGIVVWAADLSGKSLENRMLCPAMETLQNITLSMRKVPWTVARRQNWLHPTVVQYLSPFVTLVYCLGGTRVFQDALMHAMTLSLTKDISMTSATFPNVFLSRKLCADPRLGG